MVQAIGHAAFMSMTEYLTYGEQRCAFFILLSSQIQHKVSNVEITSAWPKNRQPVAHFNTYWRKRFFKPEPPDPLHRKAQELGLI